MASLASLHATQEFISFFWLIIGSSTKLRGLKLDIYLKFLLLNADMLMKQNKNNDLAKIYIVCLLTSHTLQQLRQRPLDFVERF